MLDSCPSAQDDVNAIRIKHKLGDRIKFEFEQNVGAIRLGRFRARTLELSIS
jgi:hypothetical protein